MFINHPKKIVDEAIVDLLQDSPPLYPPRPADFNRKIADIKRRLLKTQCHKEYKLPPPPCNQTKAVQLSAINKIKRILAGEHGKPDLVYCPLRRDWLPND